MTAWWLTGDSRAVMTALPAGSVDLVLTSPPFLALRSYLPDNDPAKVHEIGSEANPAEFIDTLLDVTEACARLLTPHGTLCVELGDTYAGGGNGPDARNGWPLDKSLSLIPEAYRMALAYGRNPHNGRTTDTWRIRNVIRWVRPNPPVGALGDKFRPATSELVVACKSATRWFDLDAVRVPGSSAGRPTGGSNGSKGRDRGDVSKWDDQPTHNAAGAPPLDWWQISPGGYPGSHYAVFPPELCVRPVEAMCPRRVCRTCGAPSVREAVVEQSVITYGHSSNVGREGNRTSPKGQVAYKGRRQNADDVKEKPSHHQGFVRSATTTGWSTCGCPGSDGIRLDGYHTGPGWRPGLVLDPFGGSGTTASVASGHSRDSVSIDLDKRNADLARDRIGMWFEETTADDLAARIAPQEIAA